MNGCYESVSSAEAIAALQENYGHAGAIYKFWADWPDVISALAYGWTRADHHPAQLHYAWDVERQPSLRTALERTTRTAAEHLQLSNNTTVRDAGCEFGGCTTQLARKHATWSITGVTIVHDQAYIASERLRRQRLHNATIMLANCLDLPQPDGTFDGVLAIESFCHVPRAEKRRLANEKYRVTKPRGRIVILDGYEGVIPSTAQADYERFLHGLALPRLPSADDTRGAFEAEGFRNVHGEDLTRRIIAAAKIAGSRRRFFRPIIKRAAHFSPARAANRGLECS